MYVITNNRQNFRMDYKIEIGPYIELIVGSIWCNEVLSLFTLELPADW